MQYKRLKKRHIVYIVILVVWLAACITGYINVNRRFPQPALRAGIRLLVRIIGFVMMISIKTEDGL